MNNIKRLAVQTTLVMLWENKIVWENDCCVQTMI